MKIALMGDLHYSLDERAEVQSARDNWYRAILDRFLAEDADFHVALGDLTHHGTPPEWERLWDLVSILQVNRRSDFSFVLGNHDTLGWTKRELERWSRQPRYFMQEGADWRLVLLDTTKEASRQDWGGEVDAQQLRWLQGIVKGRVKTTLLLGHHPFPNTTTKSADVMMSIDNAEELTAALASLGPDTVYCNGHNHVNSLVRAYPDKRDPSWRNPTWTYVQCGAPLSCGTYCVLEVTREGVKLETRVLGSDMSAMARHLVVNINGYMDEFVTAADADLSLFVPRLDGDVAL